MLLNENMIREKAMDFGSLLGISNFSYSNGWLQKFKGRFGIKSYYFHGDANIVPPVLYMMPRLI